MEDPTSSSARSSSDITDLDRSLTRHSAETIGHAANRNSTTEEAVTSFGEPLHVSVTRGTSRFRSIQRSFSRPLSIGDEEAATGVAEAGNPGGFNLTGWLTGRQEQQGPPFAKRVGLVFDDLTVYGDDVANRHIGSLVTPFYKIIKNAAHGFGVKKLFSASAVKPLLHSMSGVVEDGEMLLVLGQPGAGCSTLL
ncbi:ATP-binding cassette transporter snq2, partial [Linderina macrospora]